MLVNDHQHDMQVKKITIKYSIFLVNIVLYLYLFNFFMI